MSSRKVGRPPKRKVSGDESPTKRSKVSMNTDSVVVTKPKDSRPESSTPIIFHSDAGGDFESWILCADFDQSDARFSNESIGRQCMAISCAALCFMETKPLFVAVQNRVVPNWSKDDLNFLLESGDNLYTISKSQNPNSLNVMNFEDVYPYIELNELLYHFSFNTELDESNDLKYIRRSECTVDNLVDAIRYFSGIGVEKAIFTCREISISVMFSGGKFIFFDSHKRMYDGYPVNEIIPDGTAVLCINKEIIGLVNKLWLYDKLWL